MPARWDNTIQHGSFLTTTKRSFSCHWSRLLKCSVFIVCIVILILFIVFQSIGGRYKDISFILLFVVVLLPALSAAVWSQCSGETRQTSNRSIINSDRLAFVIEHDDSTTHSTV